MRSEELRRFRFGRARCDEDGQAPVGRLRTDKIGSGVESSGMAVVDRHVAISYGEAWRLWWVAGGRMRLGLEGRLRLDETRCRFGGLKEIT
jgi:hypothetical protein